MVFLVQLAGQGVVIAAEAVYLPLQIDQEDIFRTGVAFRHFRDQLVQGLLVFQLLRHVGLAEQMNRSVGVGDGAANEPYGGRNILCLLGHLGQHVGHIARFLVPERQKRNPVEQQGKHQGDGNNQGKGRVDLPDEGFLFISLHDPPAPFDEVPDF